MMSMSDDSGAQLAAGLGAAFAVLFSSAGSAYATGHAGILAVRHVEANKNSSFLKRTKGFLPTIISGVLSLYGLILASLISDKIQEGMTSASGYKQLAAGLSVGFATFSSGIGLGIFFKRLSMERSEDGNQGASAKVSSAHSDDERAPLQNNLLTKQPVDNDLISTPVVLVMIFAEAIGLYGLIVGLTISAK